MRFTAATAAAILAFTSAALAVDGEPARPASIAVVSPVAQPTPASNLQTDNLPESELDINDETGDNDELQKRFIRGGHNQYGGQYGHGQWWWSQRPAKRDVSHNDEVDEDHRPEPVYGHVYHGPPGGESGPPMHGKSPNGNHDGVKRDVDDANEHKHERGFGHWFPGVKNGHKWNGTRPNDTKSGAEGTPMGPGGKHGGDWHGGDQHGKSKREAGDGDAEEQPLSAIQRRAPGPNNPPPPCAWAGFKSGAIIDKHTGATIFDVSKAKASDYAHCNPQAAKKGGK